MLRFAIPTEVYERFERLGDVMGVDTPMAVRFLASIGLAQMEAKLLPNVEPSSQSQEVTTTALALPLSESEAEPEPEPVRIGFRPRAELGELEVIGAPLVAPEYGHEWTGYMAGL
jgi:hypothetical protein